MSFEMIGYIAGKRIRAKRKVLPEYTAFAVWSEESSALRFYKNDDYEALQAALDAGESVSYRNEAVTAIYTGFETDLYDGVDIKSPWNGLGNAVQFITFEDRIRPLSMSQWFVDMGGFTSIALKNIDGSRLKYMRSTFNRCASLANVDFSGLNTRHVTTMAHMLRQTAISTVDLSPIDGTSLEDLTAMFYGCTNLQNFNFLRNFDCGNAKIFEALCRDCTGVTSFDLSFDTHSAESLRGIFYGCTGLKTAKLSLDARKAKDIMYLFGSCSSLTTLDLSECYVQAVENMERICDECSALTKVDLSGFTGSRPTSTTGMFRSCSSLVRVDLSPINLNSVTNTNWMFLGCSKLITIYVADGTDMTAVETSTNMFSNCSKLMGGNGTTFITGNDATYARIDTSSTKGYFSAMHIYNYKGLVLPYINTVLPDRSTYKYYIIDYDGSTVFVSCFSKPLTYQYVNVSTGTPGYYPAIKMQSSEASSISWYNIYYRNGQWDTPSFNTRTWDASEYSNYTLWVDDCYWANHTIKDTSGNTWMAYEAPNLVI